jgi:hypothetical protein
MEEVELRWLQCVREGVQDHGSASLQFAISAPFTCSGTPPTAVATTGVPQAMA